MKRNMIILLAVTLPVLGALFIIQDFYKPTKKTQYRYSSTDFVQPSENFINCFADTDCLKVKGSSCPPSEGGSEACVNKNYFQEYISEISKQAGEEWEVMCPQVYMITNKTCNCFEGKCSLT